MLIESKLEEPLEANLQTRRSWLGSSFAGLAISAMMARETSGVGGARGGEERSVVLHHPARAKRVIQIFLAGAASQVDLFDYKPLLEKLHGEKSDFGEAVETFQDGLGPWLKPVWKFRPYGQSGKYLSDVVSPLGEVVDDLAFVHNMVGKTGVHSQATMLQTTGFDRPGFPSAGTWVGYALGNINDNLPTFVVLPDHRGFASNGVKNWDSAFLPASLQGTIVYPHREVPIDNLYPPERPYLTTRSERESRRMMELMNRQHALSRSDDHRLESRIASYELAGRMQMAAPEALDLSDEPEYVLRMYGLDAIPSEFPSQINAREEIVHFSRKCLAARRLIERGVRFVQIWSGNDNGFPRRNWDSHEDIERDHGPLAAGMARGASALIQDLKQRGLFEDTVILCTTEFGRMPSSQGGRGRDHNPHVFTNWLGGGGIRGGVTYGESDAWGFKPLERERGTQVHDIHATLLHLLGIDHLRLTVRHGGIDRRLTDVHGHVLHSLLQV